MQAPHEPVAGATKPAPVTVKPVMFITVPTGCAPAFAIVSVVGVAAVPPKILGVMVAEGMAGQLTVEVSGGSAAAGVGVCTQVSVAGTSAGPGTQLRPIAGALAPKAAGPVMVRFAPAVIANADAPVAGMVHANPKLPPAVPAVATFTGTEPTPPVKVTGVVSGLTVGASTGGSPPIVTAPDTYVQLALPSVAFAQPEPTPFATVSGVGPAAAAAAMFIAVKLQRVPLGTLETPSPAPTIIVPAMPITQEFGKTGATVMLSLVVS